MDERFDFSAALRVLKDGGKVAREGWNGKGMWLVLVPGTPQVTFADGTPYQKAGLVQANINSHIDMFTAQGTMQPGWLASQTDLLADDWCNVERSIKPTAEAA